MVCRGVSQSYGTRPLVGMRESLLSERSNAANVTGHAMSLFNSPLDPVFETVAEIGILDVTVRRAGEDLVLSIIR